MPFRVIRNVRVLQPFINNNLKKTMSSSSSLTSVEFSNGIKKITMCDLKTRNSLSLAMMESLLDNINNDKDNQDLRVIILTAHGTVFSAGHNLKELMPDSGRSKHQAVFHLANELMLSIIDSPVPIIAQVDGLAAAAGCQLVAQCDIAVCTESSKFSTPGANFGIFCSTPGIPLARKVSKSTALHMLLTGLSITAAEAKNSGLITKTCPAENLESEVKTICDAIMLKSRAVIHLGKKFYYKQIEMDIKRAYEEGETQMVKNLETVDGKEGIRSFVEKRKPVWLHRSS